MRLRKPCKEHGRYDGHDFWDKQIQYYVRCLGGEFLPEGALREVDWCVEHGASFGGIVSGVCWVVREARAKRPTAGNDKCRKAKGSLFLASQVGEAE